MLITGAMGSGKSRVARELKRRTVSSLHPAKPLELATDCSQGSHAPLAPLLDAMEIGRAHV